MQAILVKRLGWTNNHPARIKLSCTAGSKTYSQGHFDDTNDMQDMIKAVKHFILVERRWPARGYQISWGQLANNDWVFTLSSSKDGECMENL